VIKILKNYLSHDESWNLACAADGTPAHWWSRAIKHNKTTKPIMMNNNIGGYREEYGASQHITNSVNSNDFTYRFSRSTNHVKGCGCWECTFKKEVLESEKFKDVIRKNTGIKNPVIHETFTSAYYPGDFLGRHTDEKRGVAFIFNLSWDWKPEYGGILNIENGDTWTSYVPGGGDLLLLELGETGKVHFVSEVSSFAPRPRLAISGWYNDAES
jgi:hypothetical protein